MQEQERYAGRPPTTLPIVETVAASYAMAFSRTAWTMPLVWIPVLLTIVFSWIISLVPESAVMTADGVPVDPATLDPVQRRHVAEIGLLTLVRLVFLVSVNISWMRYVVRGEKPLGAYFGSSFWRYLGFSIVFVLGLGLLAGLLAVPASLLLAPHADGTAGSSAGLPAAVVMALLGGAAAAWIVTRCILKFVAIAVDDATMTLARSFALMRGNVLPWIAGTLLFFLPILFALILFEVAENRLLGASLFRALVGDGLIKGVLGVVQVLVSGSFFGLAYRQIVTGARRDITA